MRKTLRPLAVFALFLSIIAIPVNSNARAFDNTFNFTGVFNAVNPCNGELVSGPIDINIVVSTTQTGNGETKVNVHHTSHGALSGSEGNDYQVSRKAKGQFDAVSNQYIVDWSGNFIGKGSTPNFTAEGKLRVFTNAQNEPIGSNLVSITTACR